jgi:esterase/lipase superfamily enzyme
LHSNDRVRPMTNVTVYFATNRKKESGRYRTNSVPNDPAAAAYAVAEVRDVSLDDADAGNISSIHDENGGDFLQSVKDRIIGSGSNLLVFIHGADNSFEDAIKRAAFNREWFAASKASAANTSVIAFTWPSSDQFFSASKTTEEAYLEDQTQAGKSDFHIANFLRNISALRTSFQKVQKDGRIFLLAHSMGNYALQGAVQDLFANHEPDSRIFDQVFLAAPDEVADTFLRPNGGRLSNLPKLTDRISVYFSRRDFLMLLSRGVNGNVRLGYNGPTDKLDRKRYPENEFRLVDCTDALDYAPVLLEPSHQYYRKSPAVRADIVACMVNKPKPDGGIIDIETESQAGPDLGAIA